MKILVIQENGRHDENRKYRECFSLQRAFVSLGHECVVWGLNHETWGREIDFDSFDLILNLEQYSMHWLPYLLQYKKPRKFFWSIDSHCRGTHVYEDIFHKHGYDLLLHSTKRYVQSDYHRWIPNAFDDGLIKPMPDVKREHFIGFCGNWVNRENIYNILKKRFGVKLDIWVLGDAMVETINSYIIQMNRNHSYDVNYRNFETIGCGTVLLTNWNDQLEELGFVDGENCILYNDAYASIIPTDLEKIVEQYQNNPKELERIRLGGLELSKRHTYLERAKTILRFL